MSSGYHNSRPPESTAGAGLDLGELAFLQKWGIEHNVMVKADKPTERLPFSGKSVNSETVRVFWFRYLDVFRYLIDSKYISIVMTVVIAATSPQETLSTLTPDQRLRVLRDFEPTSDTVDAEGPRGR